MLGVLIAQKRTLHRDAPVYAQRFIQDAYATIGLGVVELVTLVLEDGGLAEYGEAVGEALRDEELAMVVFGEFYSYVLTVGWGAFANVNGYIQDGAFDTANKFALGKGRALEM